MAAETGHRSIAARTLDGLRKVGPLGTARYACVFLGDRLWRLPGCRALFSTADRGLTRLQRHLDGRFDREYGTVTSGRVPTEDLTIDSPNLGEAVWYEPMSITIFHGILGTLAVDFARFTFVDFGSGMGRVLLMASGYGFKKVVGVEFAPELHEIASNNVRVYSSRTGRATDTETVCEDATGFAIPPGPLILIFHGKNPRSTEMFEALGFSETEFALRPDWTRFTSYRSIVFTSPQALEAGGVEGDSGIRA